ncbi:hypothetical protein DICPUDRAFT_83775 [Dictyostelium purpureum]|uniref:Uncharacterized protein n=1 Tax=Dictyostelium purpureum TaxID=5786 RepID=F1A0K9_DICPU|nr:uncharacterized protein DICPUDRAFT_83775 [Dictyostelium purpureum]EGC30272.1 hypothetical protein DICPUDRAFT_83775 [Dictyostelium purpureum]|eukprot:XP_003293199.1 hypothetical protein DICPUDRAFT_83775 [Dictyostelium purpureum]
MEKTHIPQPIEEETNYCGECKSIKCKHSKYHVCQLHLDFKEKIYPNEIGEFLILNHEETKITSVCNDKCIQSIASKYDELKSYLDNMKFYYLSLMPKENGFFNCPIDLKDFENYMEGRLIPSSKTNTLKRVEESIKFKLRNNRIYLNDNLTEYQKKELYGLKYTTGSFPSLNQEFTVYEINKSTPILGPNQ